MYGDRACVQPDAPALCLQIPPGEDKSLLIESDATPQPLGSRRSSRHNEQMANFMGRSLAAAFVLPGNPLQVRPTFEANDFRFEMQFDGGVRFDSLDQVA